MRIDTSKNGKSIVVRHDSYGGFIDFIDQNKREKSGSMTGDDSWRGGVDYQGALDLARHGWPEGLKDMSVATDKVMGLVSEEIKQYRWETDGLFFDVAEMLTGAPEHWLQPDPDTAPIVHRIGLNISKSCSVSTDQIMNLGAAVASLVDYLQQKGDIVELDILSGNRDIMSKNLTVVIPIDTRPLDLDTVAFAAAHPAMLRRFEFMHSEIVLESDNCGNYGYPNDAPSDIQSEYTLYIGTSPTGKGMRQFDTPESAAQWVLQQIDNIESPAA